MQRYEMKDETLIKYTKKGIANRTEISLFFRPVRLISSFNGMIWRSVGNQAGPYFGNKMQLECKKSYAFSR